MTILNLGTASHALRRRRHGTDGRRGVRAVAVPHTPLAWRSGGRFAYAGGAVLDLALCLILAAVVAGLLLLAL